MTNRITYLFSLPGSDPPAQMPEGSFHKPAFLECVKEEYQACREGVGVMDLSSFTKIEVTVKRKYMRLKHSKSHNLYFLPLFFRLDFLSVIEYAAVKG